MREAAEALGYDNVRTLVASGNLVFDTKKTTDTKLESAFEAAIEETFGAFSEVMVRNQDEWAAIIKANPSPKKAKEDPPPPIRLPGLQGKARHQGHRRTA
ncbi:MAG: DUF1697 domain-containing protein [Hyphomonadaceae bacterium]